MKKRFLPFMMAILVLGQFAIADNGGHYVPRTQGNTTAESFMGSLRANQHTGLIDPALMLQAAQNQSKATKADELYWISMGPDNMGGQTTAVLFDNKTNWVYIGSKGGGVYVTYNAGITWHQVGDQNLMVSCMAQDADGVIYVGTGDCGAKTATYNGLDQQGYENSFIGSGIYMISNGTFTQMASTAPTTNAVTAWSFVNDLAVSGNKLLAATEEGLKCTADKGATWTTLLEGVAKEVKVLSDGTIMASVDGQLFIGKEDNLVCHSTTGNNMSGDTLLPKAAGLLDIAFAPSNEDVMYASCINGNGAHTGIYVSYNKGANWEVALPAVTQSMGNNVYGGYGLYNHGIVVDPKNEGRLYILGYYLWKIEKPETFGGYYLCEEVSGLSMYMLPDYLHVGLHALAFNPRPSHPDECYFGTDGGVYKATHNNGNFSMSYSNRNYVTTRMFNVAYSGKDTRVLAAGLDHGVVRIEGDENLNTLGHGDWVNNDGLIYGLFMDGYHAGPCAISNINPQTIFITYQSGKLYRSETAGEDWVSVNFTSSSTLNDGNGISTSSFRMPILLYEDFDDELNPATVWFTNSTGKTLNSGETIQLISNNHFPFNYTLTQNLANLDSIEVHDPVSARFYMAYTDVLYMTRQALDFAVETEWYLLSNKANGGVAGEPLCMALSADGDHMFVGTKEGRLFRVSNLNTVVDAESGAIGDTVNFQVTTTEITLPTEGQCVTSVAVDPRDANKIIVTLGNYGNETYVLYSSNALAEEPTLVSKQGNLPKMPVYSSVIEMNTGEVILGTEHGIYTATSMSNPNWISDSHLLGDVPVMDLKQQLISWDDQVEVIESEEGTTYTTYPGVHNKGIIYAATYGHGVFRCENFKETGAGVPDQPVAAETSISMYPNPVQGQAMVNFSVNGNAVVSYQVFDLVGRVVKTQTLGSYTEGNYDVNVDMSDLRAGSYIMRVNQGNSSSCVKFVVY